MSKDNTTQLPDLFAVINASPDYQRFIALNIQVPQVKGKRIYHRVTITGSLKDLALDLSLVLPSQVRRALENQLEAPIVYRNSCRELPSPNPNRASYTAVCSCGEEDCEHVDYAIRHFQLVQRFAEDTGRIAHLIQESQQRAQEAEQKRRELASNLDSVQQEREELIKRIETAEEAGDQVTELHKNLESKESEIASLHVQLEQRDEQQERFQREIRTYQENIEAIWRSEFWRGKKEGSSAEPSPISDEMLDMLTHFFVPMPADVTPKEKFQDNVSVSHHRVPNTMGLLGQLVDISFIREIGIGRRHNTKSGKVRIKPEVERLELLVPYKGEADIVRIITTASSKAQQLAAAHFISKRFEVDVQDLL
jgi:hypothetical protein